MQPAFLPYLTLGVGKAASSHVIELASKSYAEKGFGRFCDGSPNSLDLRTSKCVIYRHKMRTDRHSASDFTTPMKGHQRGIQ